MTRFPEIPEDLSKDFDDANSHAAPEASPSLVHSNGHANVPAPVPANGDEPIISLRSVRARVEIEAIRSALRRTGWNRKQAARLLKISYRGLLYKIRQYDITAA